MKAEADKLVISKLTNVSTILNNLETKVEDLDVGNLKTVPVDLKILIYAVHNECAKKTKFNTLKIKVNSLGKNSSCNYFNLHKSVKHR